MHFLPEKAVFRRTDDGIETQLEVAVSPEDDVELRRITAGVEQGRDIVVTSGLKEGELVIVEGIQKVHPGQIVAATVVPGN